MFSYSRWVYTGCQGGGSVLCSFFLTYSPRAPLHSGENRLYRSDVLSLYLLTCEFISNDLFFIWLKF
jgi:hypothetical protein